MADNTSTTTDQGNEVERDEGNEVERDAIVLPDHERRLADAAALGDTDQIESLQGEYQKAREKERKRRADAAAKRDKGGDN